MTELQQHSQQVRAALQQAVARAMEIKRRLGQYAVVYHEGKAIRLPPEQIPVPKVKV